jgi:hypothetical protein
MPPPGGSSLGATGSAAGTAAAAADADARQVRWLACPKR